MNFSKIRLILFCDIILLKDSTNLALILFLNKFFYFKIDIRKKNSLKIAMILLKQEADKYETNETDEISLNLPSAKVQLIPE